VEHGDFFLFSRGRGYEIDCADNVPLYPWYRRVESMLLQFNHYGNELLFEIFFYKINIKWDIFKDILLDYMKYEIYMK
jgi:hypothetical protein